MSALSKKKLRMLILQEIQKMKEDSLHSRHKSGHEHRTAKHTSCMECGYAMKENEHTCEQCGAMYEVEEYLNEGDCGCASNCDCRKTGPSVEYASGDYEVLDYDSDDDFIPDHMHFEYDHDVLEPGEAFGVGYSVGKHDSDIKIGNHKIYKGSYMAKNHMYKTAKYAAKLYQMIPNGHNLEDWMRSKLAQIADDISEVYHALDHDIYKGDV